MQSISHLNGVTTILNVSCSKRRRHTNVISITLEKGITYSMSIKQNAKQYTDFKIILFYIFFFASSCLTLNIEFMSYLVFN